MKKKIILAIVLLGLIAVVFVQNPGEVIYRIYFWKIGISQMILLPLLFLAGVMVGIILAGLRKSRP